MRMRAWAIGSALLLGGCMVGPDYQRPAIDAPDQYRFAAASDAGSVQATPDELRWWAQFGDPVLTDLIDEALAHNSNLAIAAANVEQAAALLAQTRSQLFPQTGYGATGERARSVEPGYARLLPSYSNPSDAYQAVFTATWEIDLWGRLRRLSEAARANVLASEEARRGVVLSLVASVASSYLQLRGLDGQLAVARKTLGAYGESVRLFELQFKYGQVSKMTVVQAQSQYETAAAQIPALESQIAQTEDALAVLIGRNPGPIARGKSIDQLRMPAVPAGLPSSLLEQRPDLRQAEQQLIAANAQIGAARALYFPTISLSGAYGGASTELSSLFKGESRVWNYSGSITGPLFTFGAVSGQVAQAEAAQNAALNSYQQAIRNAFSDVDNALIARQKLEQQFAAQQRLVVALREYSRLSRLQYDGGYTGYSTVLQAEQTLFPAELSLAALRASLYASAVNVYKAMGGGWIDAADSLTSVGARAAVSAAPP